MKRYVIVDPYHSYAEKFVQYLEQQGLRPVCVFTDPARRSAFEPQFDFLRKPLLSDKFMSDESGLHNLASHLLQHFDIAGVVPVTEESVLPAAKLRRMLGVGGTQPDVMQRFRNKFLLKDYLRRTQPNMRLNEARLVHSAADVFDAGREVPERFVLKPNDGTASRYIGFFHRHSPYSEIQRYFDAHSHGAVLMEEYIAGEEYMVNGQVDARGQVFIFSIFRYHRSPERPTIFYQTSLVHQESTFHAIAEYCQTIIKATGLQRSPFHMEVKVDSKGPCLIEVGARLPGHNNAFMCNAVHNNKIDVFAMAAHYYLNDTDLGPPDLQWAYYNANHFLYVHGAADQESRIYSLQGVTETESLPEFFMWVIKPELGMTIRRTTDLLTMPYSLVLRSPDSAEALLVAAQEVRSMLRWNEHISWRQRWQGDSQRVRNRLLQMGPAALRSRWTQGRP